MKNKIISLAIALIFLFGSLGTPLARAQTVDFESAFLSSISQVFNSFADLLASAISILKKPIAENIIDELLPKQISRSPLPADKKKYAEGQVIVKLKSGFASTSLDEANKSIGLTVAKPLVDRWHEVGKDSQRLYREEIDKAKTKFSRRSKRILPKDRIPDLTDVYIFEFPKDKDVNEVVDFYARQPAVEYAQPNFFAEVQLIPNDPYYSSYGSWGQSYADLWGLKKIQTETAWDQSQGDGVVVAVVDTGLDRTHPDIAANVWVNSGEIAANGIDDDTNGFIDDVWGWDFTNNDNDPQDGYLHGTHVAGTIAAVGDNGIGIIGVAPRAKIMAVKGLSDEGSGEITWLANAIIYAASNGADVINNSWGGSGSAPLIADVVSYANGLGVVVVSAAGNSNTDVKDFFPANIEDALTVAASGADDSKAYFSNWGYLIDVAAPGGGPDTPPPAVSPYRNILSLRAQSLGDPDLVVGSSYLRLAGTSMATPHVAGVAALLLAKNPALTREQTMSIIKHSADDQVGALGLDTAGWDRYYGWGRINAARAVSLAFTPPPDPPILAAVPSEIESNLAKSACGDNAEALNIFNTGGGILNWTASAPSWALLNPLTGRTPAEVSMKIITDTDQSGSVQISAPGSVNSPFTVPIIARVISTIRMMRCDVVISQASSNQQWQPFYSPVPPAVADGSGGTFSVWTDSRMGNPDIFAQRLDALGNPLWTKDGVQISSAAGAEVSPTIIEDGSGGTIVAWEQGPNGANCDQFNIRAQRLNSAGNKLWGSAGVWVTRAPGCQSNPVLTTDGNGGTIVIWEDSRSGINQIYAQRIDYSGAPRWALNGIPIASTTKLQIQHSIVSDGAGGAFIAWVDDRDYFNLYARKVYIQRIDQNGNSLWRPGGISISPDGTPQDGTLVQGVYVLSDGAGGMLIFWHDYRAYPPPPPDAKYRVFNKSDIYALRVDGAGNPMWAPGGIPVVSGLTVEPGKFSPWYQPTQVNAILDGQGGAIVVWHDTRTGDYDIYAQRINAQGEAVWPVNGIPIAFGPGVQETPTLASDEAGGAVFAWFDQRTQNGNLFAQHVSAAGESLWGNRGVLVYGAPGDQIYPYLTPMGGNTFLLSWDDYRNCFFFCTGTGIDRLGAIFKHSDFLPANQAPILDPIGNKSVTKGNTLTFAVSAQDPDGNPLMYTAAPLPASASFDAATRTFSWTPDVVGSFSITFSVTDGELNDEETVVITVTDVAIVITNLRDSPDPFSPNGDGRKDTTTISASFSVATPWRLNIKAGGLIIRTFTGTGAVVSQIWDGKDSGGINQVPDGSYTYTLSTLDGRTTKSGTVLIDTVRPSIFAVQDAPDPFSPSLGEVNTFSFTLSESATVNLKIYDASGNSVRTVLNKFLPSGFQAVTWDGKRSDGTLASPATYTYKVFATDRAYNSTAVASYPVTVYSE